MAKLIIESESLPDNYAKILAKHKFYRSMKSGVSRSHPEVADSTELFKNKNGHEISVHSNKYKKDAKNISDIEPLGYLGFVDHKSKTLLKGRQELSDHLKKIFGDK